MKILIDINTDSELIAYEAIALAFTLATFDHIIQLHLGQNSLVILNDPKSRLHGMIQSLDLYDLPKAWHDFDDVSHIHHNIITHLDSTPCYISDKRHEFDGVLTFS